MASRVGVIAGWLVVVMAAVVTGAAAETHTVGDGIGWWRIPPGGPDAYYTWADKQTFVVGDTLVFNWTGTHDVAKVTKEGFDNCSANLVLGTTQTTSPASFTLDTTVTHYFICTIDSHCNQGMKLEITHPNANAGHAHMIIRAFSLVLLALAVSLNLMTHM